MNKSLLRSLGVQSHHKLMKSLNFCQGSYDSVVVGHPLSLSLARIGQSLVKSHGQLYLQFYRQEYTLQSLDGAIGIVIDKGVVVRLPIG
jgi:hypothetical protein